MRRGDIILVREPRTPAAKARPYVVVQRDSTIDGARSIIGCPLTSRLDGGAKQRPFVTPSADNGLRRPSEIEVDLIHTHPVSRIGGVIGSLDTETMAAVDQALRRWLQL